MNSAMLWTVNHSSKLITIKKGFMGTLNLHWVYVTAYSYLAPGTWRVCVCVYVWRGTACGTETSAWGIWYNLQVDIFRIELNYRTLSYYPLENWLLLGSPHILVTRDEAFCMESANKKNTL